ncbi:MAG: metalloregulator ArsR/SmtB family transcription factor [Oscillospiraceae bacterium]|jgi:ArsR family transcriptional regulator|nr:metalloregulator ArsR/SmtB family transcription factor [Oscillospiraceae bacterium]
MTAPICDATIIHEDVVNAVRASLPEDGTMMKLAELFAVLGDGTRVKVLCALQRAEMCVCDISALLGMSKSAISHQLRTLRQAKLVRYRRDGKNVYYALDDEHVGSVFAQGLAHVLE